MHALRLAPTLLCAALSLTAAGYARAQQAISAGRVDSGTLSFDGRATMGDFTGSTTTITGEMVGGPALSAVRGWVEAPAATLKTGNGKRDTDLNKSMESGKYEAIRYELSGVTPLGVRGDTADVTLAGRFLIHGVTREVEFPAQVIRQGDYTRVQATTPVNLKDYRIGGLSKMLGLLKMNAEIVVHIDLVFAAM
ncbi:MAG: YceI family protein [Gemmatimonadales bacterium]